MPRCTTLLTAALIAVLALAPRLALAESLSSAETQYAALLRTINPHLQQRQSLSFARSMLANAERSGLDPQLLTALVTVESSWRPDAISRSGARGLGQLMPSTARRLGVNPADPAQNLHGAARYLRSLIDRFAGRGREGLRNAIGAYNAGPKAVERFHGIPPYGETQHYVSKVMSTLHSLEGRLGHITAATPDEKTWLPKTDASALALGTSPVQAHTVAPAELPEATGSAER